jgi:hypothetical protein
MNRKFSSIALGLAIGWIAGFLVGMSLGPPPQYTPEMLWKAGIVIDGSGRIVAKNMHIILDGSDENHPAFTINTKEEGSIEEQTP